MKLSEAILLGRTLVQPVAGVLTGCALGMGAAACGVSAQYDQIEEEWPWLAEYPADQLPCECKASGLGYTLCIAHLFDTHCMNAWTWEKEHWSLERIADWIATVEPEEVALPTSETNGECSLGTGPKRSSLEVETAETKTILI